MLNCRMEEKRIHILHVEDNEAAQTPPKEVAASKGLPYDIAGTNKSFG